LIFDHIIFASQNSKFAFGRISTSAPAKAINFWPPGAAKPFCGGKPRARHLKEEMPTSAPKRGSICSIKVKRLHFLTEMGLNLPGPAGIAEARSG